MFKRKKTEWNPDDVLAKQLAMNEQTWAALRQHGVTAESEVKLDFFYDAPNLEGAEQLAEFLRDQTDYDVQATDDSVSGSTQPTAVDLDVLNEWVGWMVAAGAEYGRCRFDGWGAMAPA